MSDEEWQAGWTRCLGLQLSGKTLNDVDRAGEPISDDTFLFCLNSHFETVDFTMPAASPGHTWELMVDTFAGKADCSEMTRCAVYPMMPRSATLFREVVDPEASLELEKLPAQMALAPASLVPPTAAKPPSQPKRAPAKRRKQKE